MFGLDGTRLDPSSGTPNSALAGLQKNKKSLSLCNVHVAHLRNLLGKYPKWRFLVILMVNLAHIFRTMHCTHISRTFVHLRVWLSRRLYSKDSNEVGKVANDSTSVFSWKSASMLSMMSTISPRIRFLPSSSPPPSSLPHHRSLPSP